MSVFEMIAAGFGLMIILVVLWNLRSPRIRGDDRIEPQSDVWLIDDWPA